MLLHYVLCAGAARGDQALEYMVQEAFAALRQYAYDGLQQIFLYASTPEAMGAILAHIEAVCRGVFTAWMNREGDGLAAPELHHHVETLRRPLRGRGCI